MTFSDFGKFLYVYCAGEDGKRKGEFTAILIERIMEDGCGDLCPVLDTGKAYLRNILSGNEPLPTTSANAMLAHIDKERFSMFIQDRLTVDSAAVVSAELKKAGFDNNGTLSSVGDACAALYESILIDITGGRVSLPTRTLTSVDEVSEAMHQLRGMLEGIKPAELSPPTEITPQEHGYVSALYDAYGSACNIHGFCAAHLNMKEYSLYKEDLVDRRIEYFSAEAIKRGVQEVFGGSLSDQFEVLKQETYDGIKNTIRKRFPDGYERMLAVMEQVLTISVDQYLLAHTQYWIGNKIRCGVCHHLVNEGKMQWV